MTIADVHRGYSVKKKAYFFNRITTKLTLEAL